MNKHQGIWKIAWQRLKSNVAAMFGLALVSIVILAGLLAPVLTSVDPSTQILEFRNQPPGFAGEVLRFRLEPGLPEREVAIESVSLIGDQVNYIDNINRTFALDVSQVTRGNRGELSARRFYLLGTDHFGRDIWSRLIHGARISLVVGFSASTLSMFIGLILGAVAGYRGGLIETVIMRFTDIMFGFPTLLFLIGITAAFEPSLTVVFCAIGLVTWPGMCRLMRGQVLKVKEEPYILAAKSLGYGTARILWRHVLPNCLAPVIVTYTLGIAGAIMAEASLSFLGLGAQPPTPSWGAMINEGKDFLRVAPWISLSPGIAIAMTVLGFNLLGDGLRDALDPTMKD